MSTQNTKIQILRSYANSTPSVLNDGEVAYSFVSNTMFIGNNSNGIIKIGGEYYVKIVDDATRERTANTLVFRDESGSANLILDLIDGGGF